MMMSTTISNISITEPESFNEDELYEDEPFLKTTVCHSYISCGVIR